jgi:sodium/hydrogen antiporter
MGASGVAVVMAVIFLWGLVSARLERAYLTAPIVVVAVGAMLAALAREFDVDPHKFKLLTEATLVWVLFSDASEVRFRDFRADLGFFARLLGIGLPLSLAAGSLLAGLLIPGLTPWLALLVGAALVPTDAALGVAVVTNRAVPARVRRLINVESGLNDGMVTPVVLVAIAGAAHTVHEGVGNALIELLIGVAVGAGVGLTAGWLLRRASRQGWVSGDFAGPAVLALAIGVYAASTAAHGNGFVAAFIAGLTFGNAASHGGVKDLRYVSQTGELASLLVWMLVGATVPASWRAPSTGRSLSTHCSA